MGKAAPTGRRTGGRFAFNRWDENEVASIYVMRADGTHRHRVTHPPVGYEDDGYKSWSPRGSRLVFGRYSDRRDQEAVFIVHVDGGTSSAAHPVADGCGPPRLVSQRTMDLIDTPTRMEAHRGSASTHLETVQASDESRPPASPGPVRRSRPTAR